MNKKSIIGIGFIGVLIVLLVILTLRKPSGQYQQTIKAIPTDAAIVIKANGLLGLFSSLSTNNYWQTLPANSFKKDIEELKISTDSLCFKNSNIDKILNDSTIFISFHQNENKSLGILFYIPFGTNVNVDIISAKLYLFFKKTGYDFVKYNPSVTNRVFNHFQNQKLLYYFFEKGIMVLGNKVKNLSEAYQQIRSKKSLLTDTCFAKVYSTTGKKVAGNIFINMQKITSIFASSIQPSNYDDFNTALDAKGWAALDINIGRSFISLHGFSTLNSTVPIWLKVVKNEQPVENRLCKVLPESTSFYSSFTISDPYSYKLAFNSSSRTDLKLGEKLKKLRQVFGSNIDEQLFNIMSESVAMIVCHKKGSDDKVYCIVKTRGNIEALDYIRLLGKNKSGVLNHGNLKNKKNTDTIFENITFQKLSCNNLPVVLFGEAFNTRNYSYACNFKEYVLFGESEESLSDYLSEIIENKNITSDTIYQNVISDLLASKTNITLYFSIPSVWNYLSPCFNSDSREKAGQYMFNIKSNSVLGIQVSANGQFLYNNIFLYSEAKENNGPELAWTADLDSSVELAITLPGSSSNNNQYFIQDKKNNIYLISSTGKILWKQPLAEKIIGMVYLIDYYKNNKQQILFNTAEKLYLIDKKGKKIKGFPVKFKSLATNGIAVTDFDGNKNYRYYLAFKNNTFIALAKDGKKVEGWKFDRTLGNVKKPAQFFTFQKKDYILISDSSHVYLLNRKGEQRLKINKPINQSINNQFFIDEKTNYFRLITTDTIGRLVSIYPDGHVEFNNLGKFSGNHYFDYEDLNYNGKKDYLFFDGITLSVFNPENKNILTTHLTDSIFQRPVIVKSKNDNLALFISLKAADKVIMLDKEGKMAKGFPINGNFPMNVISLADDNYSFAVFTGIANKLYCYYVK